MAFTLKDFVNNPMGKGSTVIPNLSELKEKYRNELRSFDADSVNGNKIRMKVYKKGSSYLVIHFNIPSRAVELEYDVVFEINLSSSVADPVKIDDMEFKVFSNCPSFVFSYAHVFDKQGKLVPWLKIKYDKEIFRKSPNTRNPNQVVGIERSIYLCALYLLTGGRNRLLLLTGMATNLTNNAFIVNLVKKDSEILERYKYLKARKDAEAKNKKDDKPKEPTPPVSKRRSSHKSSVNKTGKTGKTSKTKHTSKTKKTKKI